MNSKDDTNTGILFNNSDDWKIIQQGKLNLEGLEQRIIGVKRLNKEGQPIVELYRAIGTLKANDDKQSEKSPDAKGVVNKLADNGALTISAWKETSEKGNSYTSLKCREFSNEYNQDEKNDEKQNNEESKEDISDDIPF
jgi:uncharacterized protein (DUF736 family)